MFRDEFEDDTIAEQHSSIFFGCGAEARKTASMDGASDPGEEERQATGEQEQGGVSRLIRDGPSFIER
jgi:hypothetical protein